MRTLKSNKQRKHLWYASDGNCKLCGKPLDATWEADHKTPWAILPETNVHEMQATCQFCNRQKGDSILSWRLHQEEMIEICNSMLANVDNTSEILASITPGGGKSALPVILVSKLIPTIADKICWIVPRDNLRWQGEMAFIDRLFIMMTGGHTNTIRATQNEIDPSRGTQGYITTYQSVARDPDLHRYEFARHRYILFLDEPHHVRREGDWHKALQPLIDTSELVIYASGTFERGDKRPIAFVPYINFGDREIIDLTPTSTRKVISYTRPRALEEDAIVPLNFEILDGRAEWVNIQGEIQSASSFNDDDVDHRAALYTALNTAYAYELLEKCVIQWQAHRSTIYNKAKLLVVAPNISAAKKYKTFLTKDLSLRGVDIATSDESQAAKKAINRFKTSSHFNILITVGMAYEGLDVKEITFVACLTYYRSKPWLEQCFARANRTDEGKKYGVIWGPNDPDFLEVVEKLKAEQTEAAREPGEGLQGGGGSLGQTVPIASESTDRSAIDLFTGKILDADKTKVINDAANIAKLNGVSTVQLDTFLLALIETGYVSLPDEISALPEDEPGPFFSTPLVTPSQREANLKNSINKVVRRYCAINDIEHWRPNKEIKDRFGKSRDRMNVDELAQVWRYVQEQYKDDN
jgi:superfamily II DNA or RNA helicase